MWSLYLVMMLIVIAPSSKAGHDYYKSGAIGEYYEYDVEGSPRERKFRNHRYHAAGAIKKPLKVLWLAQRYSFASLKKTRKLLENYLKGAAHNEEEQRKLAHALTDWESTMAGPHKKKHKESPHGLLYVPSEAWRLFKYSFYLAGFALPRALKHGAKNIIVNTCGSERQEGGR